MLAIFEIYAFCYIYGVQRICKDVKFMLGFVPNKLYRACWWFITPSIMTAIVIYSFVFYENPLDGNLPYPFVAYVVGWFMSACGLIWFPVFLVWNVLKQKDKRIIEVGDMTMK